MERDRDGVMSKVNQVEGKDFNDYLYNVTSKANLVNNLEYKTHGTLHLLQSQP